MSEQTLRFRLGIFVLAALILLAVLITLFGGLPNIFKHFDRYSVVFDDATGVAPGTPVRRAGVRIGEVESVGLDDDTGKAVIGIKVDSRYPLRKDDQPTLVRGLIGGDTSVDFVRRRPPPEPLEKGPVEPGSVLKGTAPGEPGDLARQASQLMPPARESLEELARVLGRLDKMMPLMDQTLREFRDLAQAGRQTLPPLRDASDEVRALAKAGQQTLPSIRQAADELRDLARSSRATLPELRRTNEDLQAAARSWNKAGDRFDSLLRANEDKLTRSLDQLNGVLRQASAMFSAENQRNFTEALRRSNDAMARADVVMSDMQKASKPLAERTPTILRNLDEGTARLNRALTGLDDLFRLTSRSDGTLQRLLADPSLYQHLDEAACMVTRMLPRVDRVLQDVEIFADRIARHPEALGLSGALRPASGLKEPPSSSYYRHPGH